MNRRLVLKSSGGKIFIRDLENFLETAKKYGVNRISDYAEFYLNDDKELRFDVILPENKKVVGKRSIIIAKRDKRRQMLVDAQLAKHREDKKNGVAEGYVPPVGRTKPPTPKKSRCPRCGIRKPIQNVGGVKTLKAHNKSGNKCPGSGVRIGTP